MKCRHPDCGFIGVSWTPDQCPKCKTYRTLATAPEEDATAYAILKMDEIIGFNSNNVSSEWILNTAYEVAALLPKKQLEALFEIVKPIVFRDLIYSTPMDPHKAIVLGMHRPGTMESYRAWRKTIFDRTKTEAFYEQTYQIVVGVEQLVQVIPGQCWDKTLNDLASIDAAAVVKEADDLAGKYALLPINVSSSPQLLIVKCGLRNSVTSQWVGIVVDDPRENELFQQTQKVK